VPQHSTPPPQPNRPHSIIPHPRPRITRPLLPQLLINYLPSLGNCPGTGAVDRTVGGAVNFLVLSTVTQTPRHQTAHDLETIPSSSSSCNNSPTPSPPLAGCDPHEPLLSSSYSRDVSAIVAPDLPPSHLDSPAPDLQTFADSPPPESTMSSESAILPLSSLFHSASTSSFSGVSFASSAYNVDFIGFGEMEALDFDDDNMQLEEEDDDADNIMMNEEDDMAIDELPLSALHPHIAAEGQFRAGTPTPIHTSPPTEMIVPPPMTHSLSTSSSSSSASTSHSDDNNDSSSTSSTPVHPLSALSLSETANPAGVAMDDGNNVTLTPSATTTLDVDPLIIQTTQPNNLQAVIMNYFDVPNVLWTYIPISPQGVEIPDEPQPQTSETPQEIVTEDLDHECTALIPLCFRPSLLIWL